MKTPKKTPYLAGDQPADTAQVGDGDTPVKERARGPSEPVLRDNEFLAPQGDIRLWVGLLIVPFVVLLFAFLQGVFSGDDADEAADPELSVIVTEEVDGQSEPRIAPYLSEEVRARRLRNR